MNRFHSSGTASGKVEVMWRWKMTIPIDGDRRRSSRPARRAGSAAG